jgi:hypothetical protein
VDGDNRPSKVSSARMRMKRRCSSPSSSSAVSLIGRGRGGSRDASWRTPSLAARRVTDSGSGPAGHATRFGRCKRTVTGSDPLRLPGMPRPPRHSSVTSMVSDSGSETGAASSAHMRPAAVRCGQLDRAQCSDQHIYSSPGALFECLRGSGRRGRRFKSGHPD